MNSTAFYAWQSDRPQNEHRYLIRDALQDAIDRIKRTAGENGTGAQATIDAAPPIDAMDGDLELDHDTKGVGGTPNIAETIRDKISACRVFVADLTFVGAADGPAGSTPPKLLPNPNVLIELGMAVESVGWERIILVMNTAYGEQAGLPFDLRHRRFPITYKLPPGDQAAARKAARKELAENLYIALRGLIGEWLTESTAAEPAEAMKQALRGGDAGAVEDVLDPPLRKLKSYLDRFTFDAPVSDEAYTKRVHEIDSLATPLMRAAFVAGRRDTGNLATKPLQAAIKAAANWEPRAGGYSHAWKHLRSYPPTLLLYAAGLGALMGERYNLLASLWQAPISPGLPQPVQCATHLFSIVALLEPHSAHLPGVTQLKLPGSHWVLRRLETVLNDLLPVDTPPGAAFDRYELFAAAAALDLGGSPLPGRFVDSLDQMGRFQKLGELRTEFSTAEHPLTAVGLFGGSIERLRRRVNEVLQAARQHNPFLTVQF